MEIKYLPEKRRGNEQKNMPSEYYCQNVIIWNTQIPRFQTYISIRLSS